MGGDGVEPPESKDSRFTVCPATPTVYPPLFKKFMSNLNFYFTFHDNLQYYLFRHFHILIL